MLVKPRTPSGFPEYLPGEQLEFNRLLGIIRSTYELHGFSPLDTPDIELSEVLLAKSGGDTAKQVYRFNKGDTDLSLRFDLTVPLARYVAEHQANLVFPFRRYHIGKVHRGERAQAGRFREFYQCDIDVIGSKSPIVDAEFPVIINQIFEKFDFGEFTMRVNNRKVLNGFFEEIDLADKSVEALRLVDKIEKLERADLIEEFKRLGLDDTQIERLLQFVTIEGDNSDVLAQLQSLGVKSALFQEGLSELNVLVDALRAQRVPENRFRVDLKIARGLDYYTGTVYETVLNDLPGVGISIGLTRLFYKLREAGIIEVTRQSPADIVVLPLGDDQIPYGLEVSDLLRQAGLPTLHYTEPGNVRNKFRYANRMGYKYALVLGENEAKDKTVTVRRMDTGDSTVVAMQDVVASLRD